MKNLTNLQLLKLKLKELNLDYFLVPNSDEFLSEYLPDYAKRLQFLTGFSGSNAFVIIAKKGQSAFFTDGRYILQANMEVDQKEFTIFDLASHSPLKWLLENAKKNSKIGFDPSLHNINFILNYQKYWSENLISLVQNPIDQIWTNQPLAPKTKIFRHLRKYCGLSFKEKLKKIINDFAPEADALILTNPASICWLFNIRAADISYCPLHLSYAIIDKKGKAQLLNKTSAPLGAQTFCAKLANIQMDFSQANYQIYQSLKSVNFNIINKTDPCLIHKAIKNETEIKNAFKAHQLDGLALTKFLFWLENAVKRKVELDEISIAKKLLEFRQNNKEFFYESFAPIVGFASNGAIIHYHANKKTNKKITGNGLLLIDSGGQYLEGTTDVTRTILIGKANKRIIDIFTLVLKGHINLSRAKFPIGTKGFQLDSLARFHLWQKGLDYAHGTGHGVGSFLSVHESPPSISKRDDGSILQEGMILSNEPGFYEEGKFGIRIENLILVEKSDKQFLKFKTLTLAPIDHRLINFKMLTYPERKWLFEYHQEIYAKLKEFLSEEERKWLKDILIIYEKIK